jgi:uncharacterized membrane protein
MPTDARPSLLSPWDLFAAAGMLGLGVYARWILPRLPDPVPTHFDALGRANGWTAKADLPLLLVALAVLPWLVLLVIGAVNRSGGQARPTQPLRGLLSLGMAILAGSLLAVPLQGPRALVAGLVAFLLCMATGIAYMARASMKTLAGTRHEGHYRCGMFYVNPEDPRLWVEKRVGVGWTLNYGRPAAFWITALLISPVFLALGAALLARH